jgi:hypothetical protein
MTPRSPSRSVAAHCDRYVVTAASLRPRGPGGAGRAALAPPGSAAARFGDPSYHAPHTTGAPPSQATRIDPWARGPGSSRQTTHVPTVDTAALRAHPADTARLRRTS